MSPHLATFFFNPLLQGRVSLCISGCPGTYSRLRSAFLCLLYADQRHMPLLPTKFFFMCIGVSCLHVCLYEGVRCPRTGVIDSCELPCRYWKGNPGPSFHCRNSWPFVSWDFPGSWWEQLSAAFPVILAFQKGSVLVGFILIFSVLGLLSKTFPSDCPLNLTIPDAIPGTTLVLTWCWFPMCIFALVCSLGPTNCFLHLFDFLALPVAQARQKFTLPALLYSTHYQDPELSPVVIMGWFCSYPQILSCLLPMKSHSLYYCQSTILLPLCVKSYKYRVCFLTVA